jgi:hypothetical protein
MIAAVKVAAAIARLDKGLVRLTSSFKLLPLARHAAPFSPVAAFKKTQLYRIVPLHGPPGTLCQGGQLRRFRAFAAKS